MSAPTEPTTTPAALHPWWCDPRRCSTIPPERWSNDGSYLIVHATDVVGDGGGDHVEIVSADVRDAAGRLVEGECEAAGIALDGGRARDEFMTAEQARARALTLIRTAGALYRAAATLEIQR